MTNFIRRLFKRSRPAPMAEFRKGWNLARWKENPQMVEEMRKWFETTMGQRFLSVLYAQIPRGYCHEPGQQLGRMNGFIECIMLIESMGDEPEQAPTDLEPTWGAEEEELQPTK